MTALVRRLRRDESGYTLTELLMAMLIGMVVLMAAFMLIDRASTVSAEIADRQEAVQRGRTTMETLTRQLRSQVCLGERVQPITYGSADRVEFYADLSDGSKNVEHRTLAYDPVAKTITEEVYPGEGVYPDLTFSDSPAESLVLLSKVERAREGSTDLSVFRYFAFDPSGDPGDLRELAVPLTTATASLVVMVKIAFEARPEGKRSRDRDSTTFYNDVYVRLADPLSPTEGPRCI